MACSRCVQIIKVDFNAAAAEQFRQARSAGQGCSECAKKKTPRKRRGCCD